MCGVLPLMAAGKVKPGAVGAAALGGLGGLALRSALKKKKPATPSEAFYGTPTDG